MSCLSIRKHVRLPFFPSQSYNVRPFEHLHCDIWTSPIPSSFGYRYYLIIVDDFTHYFWSFPLHKKSDVYATFLTFYAYALPNLTYPFNQSNVIMAKNLTTPNWISSVVLTASFFAFHAHISQQNGKAEQAIRTTNDVVRTLLF